MAKLTIMNVLLMAIICIFQFERIRTQNVLEGREDCGDNSGIPCTAFDGSTGFCESPTYCFSQFNNIDDYSASICPLRGGTQGVCCPTEQIRPGVDVGIPNYYDRYAQSAQSADQIRVTSDDLNNAAQISLQKINELNLKESALVERGIVQKPGSTAAQLQAFFGPFDEKQFNLTRNGLTTLIASNITKQRSKLSAEVARDGLFSVSVIGTVLERFCDPTKPVCCPNCCCLSKYRSADGSCNNLENPLWGRSNTCFNRLLAPDYGDGIDSPRGSPPQPPLPPPRIVSLAAATDSNIPAKQFSLFLMQWGQFLDHDLTLAAASTVQLGYATGGILCCNDDGSNLDPSLLNPACLPIKLYENDTFYAQYNQKCMNFVRNGVCPLNCTLGYREQMNTITHIIDGSMIYGSDAGRAADLRTFTNGLLKTSPVNGEEFLPFEDPNDPGCASPSGQNCFIAGDVRVNEHPGLVMIQNLLLREHNRVAAILLDLNPFWDDETLYQEARRIVAAEIQHITYNEWIIHILNYNLLQPYGYSYDYDSTVNPSIINSFAAAAYRMHTLIPTQFNVQGGLLLRKLFNNPDSLYGIGAFEEYLLAFTSQPPQTFDKYFTQEVTDHLFEAPPNHFGLDLASLNIQRGRDHGLPGYNKFRQACGLNRITSFQQLNSYLKPGSAAVMAGLYSSVDAIDLWVAGNHEIPIYPGAIVGPTFACILIEQFRRTKIGDRFWYENGNFPHSFSKAQLYQIRKSSLARLICDNSNVPAVQQLAFKAPTPQNPIVDCSQIAKVNLNLWRDENVWLCPQTQQFIRR